MAHPRRRARRFGPVVFAAFALSILLGAVAPASEPTDDGIDWRDDYARALDEAKAENRLLWIQFTGSWCPNCVRMEQDSFSQPTIHARAREAFIAVKLQADANEELAVGFGLNGLPASVVVDPSRRVVGLHQGYLGPDDLDAFLGEAIAVHKPDSKPTEETTRLASSPSVGSEKPEAKENRPVKTEDQAALAGYCPVSLVADKRLVVGKKEYTVAHEGRIYLFSNILSFLRFRREPERYVPANDGRCPVAQLDRNETVPGDPRFGALYQGRLYLCASKEERQQFLQQPARYASVDVEEGGDCPHCLVAGGRHVRGTPRYSLTQQGRRYWFPDASHRNAFLTLSPIDFVRR